MDERAIFVKLGCDGSYAVLNPEVAQVLLFLDSVQLRSKQAAIEARGVWQSESVVKHMIAKQLVDHSHLLGNLMVSSQDFV